MKVSILANLDVEARWAGGALKPAIAERVSAYAALLGVLAPEGLEAEVWAPAAVDPARLRTVPGWVPPVMRVGTPPRIDARWADAGPIGKAANDRRFAHALGFALPGTRVITSVDELVAATTTPSDPLAHAWVCKLPWTAAGRDRCRGEGAPTEEQRVYLGRLLAKTGALVAEPWCERLVDAAQCAEIEPTGAVMLYPPHSPLVDARGNFGGIDLAAPALEDPELRSLADAALASGVALAGLGFRGPFAIDAFAYRTVDGARRFHPLCELNARVTFGTIAHLLGDRLGVTRLGFTDPPPDGAIVLVDGAAWVH